jgi:UDP-3-O-[3-hydroxymyristoyl] glucosamine N-acyltransferase
LITAFCSLLTSLIYGLPACGVYILLSAADAAWWLPAVFIAPLWYAVLFAMTAGTLSLPFHGAIVRGKFPRDVRHPVYRGRRLYGTCWTALFYFKPVYFLVLTLPWLKWMTFRLFGYKGQMDFTVYPDTWIRDLPLLDFGKGVYVANRATLGTNMPLKNGRILVDGIRLGEGALISHLTMLAAGVQIGKGSEIGPGCAVGVRVKVGDHTTVLGTSQLNHASKIGDNVYLGANCYVGFGAEVPSGTKLGGYKSIPDRSSERRNGNQGTPDED